MATFSEKLYLIWRFLFSVFRHVSHPSTEGAGAHWKYLYFNTRYPEKKKEKKLSPHLIILFT